MDSIESLIIMNNNNMSLLKQQAVDNTNTLNNQ
jgi:hypothetical protein